MPLVTKKEGHEEAEPHRGQLRLEDPQLVPFQCDAGDQAGDEAAEQHVEAGARPLQISALYPSLHASPPFFHACTSHISYT